MKYYFLGAKEFYNKYLNERILDAFRNFYVRIPTTRKSPANKRGFRLFGRTKKRARVCARKNYM